MAATLKATKSRRLKPIDARTVNQLCSLQRDNLDFKGFWILTDGNEITICQQKTGETPKATISIPKAVFDRMARWYVTGKATK